MGGAEGPRCLVQFVRCRNKNYEYDVMGLPCRPCTYNAGLPCRPYQFFEVLRLTCTVVAQEREDARTAKQLQAYESGCLLTIQWPRAIPLCTDHSSRDCKQKEFVQLCQEREQL